jgi:hypothetical protein
MRLLPGLLSITLGTLSLYVFYMMWQTSLGAFLAAVITATMGVAIMLPLISALKSG